MIRKLAILSIICLLSHLAVAQDQKFALLDFKEKGDYKKHEKEIRDMAEYFLANPALSEETKKVIFANVIQWMSGTPDHHFKIDNSIMDLTKNNEAVLPLFMVASTKASLETSQHLDEKTLKLKSFEIFLEYCADKSKGVKLNRELKKAIEAKEKGNLKEYLKI